jgi:hypothetical protein
LNVNKANFVKTKKAAQSGGLFCFYKIRGSDNYLLEPALIMAQRKPMVAVAESSAMKRRVPGDR